jgi:hypothetical protein
MLHEDTARHTHFTVRSKAPLFYSREVVRPGGFELPAFWFVANGVRILNALFGVAYEHKGPSELPQLSVDYP